ncbi:alpha/beta hydrolase [Streptomyces alanosinicus]|uniref:Thioesterase n=1 Tax=Streptomyces alanosinicus TaxID=68171 RepID=A0A918YTL1_9ACTN|nr:alpha/beta fold hydrolase [Streptomyces alanosinicus]GHE16135.1 thioesterase [Streptomyces alanosinicus]
MPDPVPAPVPDPVPTPVPAPVPAPVRQVSVQAHGVQLSGLLCEPVSRTPRAMVVALHGAGMRAGYFHGQAHPSLSLLTLGAALGFSVLALDRPGYGSSSARFPDGRSLTEQSAALHAALADIRGRYATGAGIFLLAHSFGGKLALTHAAESPAGHLLGVDVSGCGHQYAAGSDKVLGSQDRRAAWQLHWGPLRLYPARTHTTSRGLVAPMPPRETADALTWPSVFRTLAPRIRLPVRLTFAEHERWWRHDDQALDEIRDAVSGAPVQVDRQPDAGHNISLGWAARRYHLRALEGFAARLGQRLPHPPLPVSHP